MSTVEPTATAGATTAVSPPRANRRVGLSRLIVFAMRAAAMGFNFAIQIVLARVMDLASFGITNTALALLNILAIPAAFGFETAAIRYVALAREDRSLLRALTVRFGLAVVCSSGVTVLLIAAAAVFAYVRGSDETGLAIAFLALIVPLYAFVRVGEAWLRGSGSLVSALLGTAVVIPLLSIGLVGVEWVARGGGHSVDVAGALSARAAATAVALAIAALLVFAKLGWRLRPRTVIGDFAGGEILRTAGILCGVAFLAAVLTQSDIVAVSAIDGAADAGIYSAAARISQSLNIALVVVNFVLSPQIARLAAANETVRLQREVSAAADWSFGLMLGAVAILVVAAPLVLQLFGSGFGGAADPLRILLAGQLLNAFCGPAVAMLTMTGGEVPAIRVLATALVLQFGLYLVLIPALGMIGAAIAATVAFGVLNLGLVAYIRMRLVIWSLPTFVERLLP